MKRQTNKPVHYRQSVSLTFSVIVDGTEKQFNVMTDDLTDAIEEFARTLIPKALGDRLVVHRGPSASQYYFPGEEVEARDEGIHVQMSALGVPIVGVD